MSSHADQTEENKSESVASAVSKMQTSSEPTFEFVDNRQEAVAQRKLQNVADSSPQVSQLKSFQEMADNSFHAKQVTQLQGSADTFSGEQHSTIQFQENNTGLPDNLKSGMENLSGLSMDDVKVHRNSDKPAQLNAHAYAQGTDIHLGPGQEKHLPHELGHVVQQKEGRVKPTKQLKGKTNINDDKGLEKEADVLGAKALNYNSAKVPVQTKVKTPILVQREVDNSSSPSLNDMSSIDDIEARTNEKSMNAAKEDYNKEKLQEEFDWDNIETRPRSENVSVDDEDVDGSKNEKSMNAAKVQEELAQDPQWQKRKGMDAAAKDEVNTESFKNEKQAKSMRSDEAESFRKMCIEIEKYCKFQDDMIALLNEKEFSIARWKDIVNGLSALQIIGGATALTLGFAAFVATFPISGPAAIVGATVASAVAGAAGISSGVAKSGLGQAREENVNSKKVAAGVETAKTATVIGTKKLAGKAAMEAVGGTAEMMGPLGGIAAMGMGAKTVKDMRKIDPKEVYNELNFKEIGAALFKDAIKIGHYYADNKEHLNKTLFELVTQRMLDTKNKIDSYNS
jgi:hypothetical protein